MSHPLPERRDRGRRRKRRLDAGLCGWLPFGMGENAEGQTEKQVCGQLEMGIITGCARNLKAGLQVVGQKNKQISSVG